MDRLNEVRNRRLEIAKEAARRWQSTRMARGTAQADIAKMGSLRAESPARAQQFQLRESMRAAVQTMEGRRRIVPGQERIIGATFDLRDLPSDQNAELAGHAVARLVDPPEPGIVPQGFGTGFMVSPRLLITNNHVFPDKNSAHAIAHFGYEHDLQGLHAGTMFELDSNAFFLTDIRLDFSLVAVKRRSFDGQALQQFGFLPLIAPTGKILMGQLVSIIQHPLGGPKQWAETENRLLFLNDDMPYLQHETDTLPGSSGSPVYNSFWEVVGLHHSGVPCVENGKIKTRTGQDWDANKMDEEDIYWVANEGVRISCLVEYLRNQKPAADLAQYLLKEMLASTADPLEKKVASKLAAEGGVVMSNLPSSPSTISVVVNGTANFYLSGTAGPPPVSLLPPSSVATAPIAPAPEKTLRFDPKYSQRSGYDPDFLGVTIPFPVISPERQNEILADQNGNPLILNYHHFSILRNKERRLMMWAAANIDYSDEKRPITARKDLGSDQWKSDPHIPEELQLEDAEFYAPAKKFDRGHIIRREDNAWGDCPTLQEFANSDTFHWTNCTPQHEAFNRSNEAGVWGELENHITEQAAGVTDSKLVIMAMPVLAEDDLEHDFGAGIVKVPIKFWKIIAVMQRSQADANPHLPVFGFLLDQATPIQERGLEAFQVGQFKTFQRSLVDISSLTGIEFPQVLRDADVKKARTSPRRLESVRDLEV